MLANNSVLFYDPGASIDHLVTKCLKLIWKGHKDEMTFEEVESAWLGEAAETGDELYPESFGP